MLERISLVGTSRDETYFSIFKGTEGCYEALRRSGFGVIDKKYSIFLSHKLQSMSKPGYISEVSPDSFGANRESIHYEHGREDIHRIMNSRE